MSQDAQCSHRIIGWLPNILRLPRMMMQSPSISAGGNLALATAVRAKEAGLPLPAALVLLSPWLDFAEEGASYRNATDDPILPAQVLDGFKLAYLGNGDRKSSLVTPLYSDLSGLPPTLVHVGSWERLQDDSITIVQHMRAAGVDAKLKIFDGMCHDWQLFAPMLEGMLSIEESAAFVKAHQTWLPRQRVPSSKEASDAA